VERKLTLYYEARDKEEEDEFFEYVHRFFCKNPNDPNESDCRLFALTVQNVVEEEI